MLVLLSNQEKSSGCVKDDDLLVELTHLLK